MLKSLEETPEEFWELGAETIDKGHGRIDIRRIHICPTSPDEFDFPHIHQIARITRITTDLQGVPVRSESAYAITDMTPAQASPEEFLSYIRGHWDIENRSHYVRDETFKEDRSTIRVGNGPRVMATLRNLAIGIFRLMGFTNIAEAVRYVCFHPQSAVNCFIT